MKNEFNNRVVQDSPVLSVTKPPIRLTVRSEALLFVVLDIFSTCLAYFLAAWGTDIWAETTGSLGTVALLAVISAVNVAVFALFHLYSSLWRYASVYELLRIVAATLCGTAAGFAAIRLLMGSALSFRITIMAWALLLILCAGTRLFARVVAGSRAWRVGAYASPRTLIVGAGETGSLAIKRMLSGTDVDLVGYPVALVDDDPAKIGHRIHDVKVLGSSDDILHLVHEKKIELILLAMPSASASQRKRVLDICSDADVRVLTLPNVRDIPTDKIGRLAPSEVNAADLLGREEVELDLDRMGYVSGKRVLVTGGGGSIGSEIVRQLLPAKPACIVIFDIYENTAYELFHELVRLPEVQGIRIEVRIGSITHLPAIQGVFDEFSPQVVFHAAAHKHVPLMEDSVREAVENNVFGTLNTARLAHERGCSHFVLVSTDKAVNPANVMGATKRMCEMVVQSYAQKSDTVFTAVRFGNVLGSHGSVLPLFRRQMLAGGPVTVTHRDITRYFMTIPEASRLVITAGALAQGGEVFVLDMGEPVRIYDLAEKLIALSGLKLGRDMDIVITGLRPGEKLFEELSMDSEHAVPTANGSILVTTGSAPDADAVEGALALLAGSLDGGEEKIREAIAQAVPTYRPQTGGRGVSEAGANAGFNEKTRENVVYEGVKGAEEETSAQEERGVPRAC